MSAMSYDEVCRLKVNVEDIGGEFFTRLAPVLTSHEFEENFIDPEHAAKIREVVNLVGRIPTASGCQIMLETDDPAIVFPCADVLFVGSSNLPIPAYVKYGMRDHATDAIRSKLTTWATERYRLGCIFGDIIDALFELNETCKTLRSMAIMLPCLPAILAYNSLEGSKGHKASIKASSGGFSELPVLSHATKLRLRDISATVAALALIEGNPRMNAPIGSCYFQCGSQPRFFRKNIFDAESPYFPVARVARFL